MTSLGGEAWEPHQRFPFKAVDDEAFDESETAWLIAPLLDEIKDSIKASDEWNAPNIPLYKKPVFKGVDQAGTGLIDLTNDTEIILSQEPNTAA